MDDTKFSWKKFDNLHARLEDRITVTKTGAIGFPTKFYEDNNIKEYKFIVVYYDESRNALGIHFTADENEKSKFAIAHSKQGYGGSAIVRSFFKVSRIDPKRYYGRYNFSIAEEEGIGKLYVFQLKEREDPKK